jgi:predicted ATPase
MITKWKLFNFKSINQSEPLEFGPLTIFAGANSSGKSTLLQSLLLISQTLSHRIRSRSVVLNGALTRLGQFDDLKSNGGAANQIVVEWECVPADESPLMALDGPQSFGRRVVFYGRSTERIRRVSCELAFDCDPDSPQRELYQLQPQLFSCRVATTAVDEENVDVKSWIEVRRASLAGEDAGEKMRRLSVEDAPNEPVRQSLELDVSLDSDSVSDIRVDYPTAEPVGCLVRHFLPDTVALRINVTEEEARAIVSTVCDDSLRGARRRFGPDRDILIPEQALALLREVIGPELLGDLFPPRQQTLLNELGEPAGTTGMSLREWSDRIRRLPPSRRLEIRQRIREQADLADRLLGLIRGGKSDRFEVIPYRPPSNVLDGVMYLDYFFSARVKYLGPLRDEPKALYPLAPGVDPTDVGLRGEYTAAVLDLNKGQRIRYIPTSAFRGAEVPVKPQVLVRTLEAAMLDWLQYLGVAENVQTKDRGKFGHELKVVLPGRTQAHDLTHVGVGVSQVLPILVMCLLAEPDTTLIFEQPELHLHPRVQTLLGDFFLSMSLLGKQCILETHSEYLINRLRFRAAASADDEVSKKIVMYFVEKPADTSVFRRVIVNEYGAIADWPAGFFDQSQSEAEAILKAATRKRQSRGGRLPRAERHN